jgi:S1-C subfamily serine protease
VPGSRIDPILKEVQQKHAIRRKLNVLTSQLSIRWQRKAALCIAVLLITSQEKSRTNASEFPRRTPVVDVVQKVRNSVVAIINSKGTFAGAGVIIDVRGYFVTNCHVIRNASKVRVRLHDGQELTAERCVLDTDCDLAILRVQTDSILTALPMGNMSDLMVGETVIALGHPYGYLNTVSTGIVSALDRTLSMPSGAELSNVIQTDASINCGNSGGPLLNIAGELIGINCAIRSEAHGIAFAINIETVKQALKKHVGTIHVSAATQETHVARKVTSEVEEKTAPEVKKLGSVECGNRTIALPAPGKITASTENGSPTLPGSHPRAYMLGEILFGLLELDWNCGIGTFMVLLLALRVGFSMGKQRAVSSASAGSLTS